LQFSDARNFNFVFKFSYGLGVLVLNFHFWTIIFGQENDYPTIFRQPKILGGQLPLPFCRLLSRHHATVCKRRNGVWWNWVTLQCHHAAQSYGCQNRIKFSEDAEEQKWFACLQTLCTNMQVIVSILLLLRGGLKARMQLRRPGVASRASQSGVTIA